MKAGEVITETATSKRQPGGKASRLREGDVVLIRSGYGTGSG